MMERLQRLVDTHSVGVESERLVGVRAQGREQFEALGFPTTRLEDWKYTSTRQLREGEYVHDQAPFTADRLEVASKAIEGLELPEAALRLVLINGRLVDSLSTLGELQDGVRLLPLGDALQEDGHELGRLVDTENQAFTALNQAFLQDGLFLPVADGVVLNGMVQLVHISEPSEQAIVAHPRHLIVLGRNARASLLQVELGGDGVTWSNGVTEIELADGAGLEHQLWQLAGVGAHQVNRIEVRQERNSHYGVHTMTLGSGWVRNDLGVGLDGPGAECHLKGLYLLGDGQHADNHTTIHHRASHCISRELYKGVLAGRSRGVFNGRVVVYKDAQKSDSDQGNHNLLLSDSARVDTKPQLEIFADDVKAAHGTTVGQLDSEALFYMRSRGIPRDQAMRILTGAFAREIVDGIEDESLREFAVRLVNAQLLALQKVSGE
ncbi:MAG: Fe-S cluster assembly protein SufD [Myxococcota bacterium]|nr:Fe-S cluster assembly protein SufD [Myxococcota bacterium]